MKPHSVALLLAGLATQAAAAPSALLRCDGYGRRVSTAETLARLPFVIGTLGILGAPEGDDPSARHRGDKGVAACTDALEDERAKGNAVRRGEVLLARAIRHLEVGKTAEVIADARAVRETAVEPARLADYQRSVGVSAWLVEATAEAKAGRQDAAERAALAAADQRPYAGFLAARALFVLALSPAITDAERALLDRAARLEDTGLLQRGFAREAAGDFAGAAADFAMRNALSEKPDALLTARTAAALALAGRTTEAEATLAKAQALVDELAARASGTSEEARRAEAQVTRADELTLLARVQLGLARARDAAAAAAAAAPLAAKSRWLAPPPLVAAVVANARRLAPALVIPVDPDKLVADARRLQAERLTEADAANSLMVLLPRFEPASVRADLARAIAPANRKLKRERVRDDSLSQVFATGTSSFIDNWQEAALLLAAREAAAADQPRFVVADMSFGLSLGREGVTAGSARVLMATDSDPLATAQASRALAVAEVEAALGPLYVASAAR